MARAETAADIEATTFLAEASTVWRQLVEMSPTDKAVVENKRQAEERWTAVCRKIAATYLSATQTQSVGDPIQRLAEARRILKQVLAVFPNDSAATEQLREAESRLLATLRQRTQAENPADAAVANQELLRHFPEDGQAREVLTEYAADVDAARAGVRVFLNAGQFDRAIAQSRSALLKYRNDPELLAMRQKAQEEQARMTHLTDQEIPKLWDERRCVAMLKRLRELEELTLEVDNLSESRQVAATAVEQARALTTQGDKLLAARKPRQALEHYQSALQVCSDYAPASTGVANASVAIRRLVFLRKTGIAAAAVALLTGAVFLGLSQFNAWQDNRAWTQAESQAQSASAKQEFEAAQERYHEYIAVNPQGRHVAKALNSIKALDSDIEKREWDKIETARPESASELKAFIEACENFRTSYPSSTQATRLMARLNDARSKLDNLDWKEAEEAARKAGNDYDKIIDAYNGYIEKHPQGVLVQFAQQRIEEARKKKERASQLKEAGEFQRSGNLQKASEVFSALLRLDPHDPDAKAGIAEVNYRRACQLAEQRENNRDYSGAEHYYLQALRFKDADPFASKRLEEVRKKKAADMQARGYEQAMERAHEAELRRDWEQALQAYNDALRVKRDDLTAGNGKVYCEAMIRGLTEKKKGDVNAAMAEFDRALNIRPADFEALQQIALLRQPIAPRQPAPQPDPNFQRYDQAMRSAQTEADRYGANWAKVESLAREAERYRPNDPAAVRVIQQARDMQYTHWMNQARNEEGWARWYPNRYRTAIAHYQEALKFRKNDSAALAGIARCQRAMVK